MRLNQKKIEAEVEAINAKREEAILAIADRVREEQIIPICQKYGMRFLSGNGAFFFCEAEGKEFRIGPMEVEFDQDTLGRKVSSRFPRIAKVLEVLDMEVGYNSCLGYYVGNVE